MKIEWTSDRMDMTADGRFMIQREHLHHEGVYRGIEPCTREARNLLDAWPGENGWYGPGALQKARRAVREMYEWELTTGWTEGLAESSDGR